MRTSWVVACLLVGSFALGAEPAKRVATIDVDGVEIRTGNALAYPSVGKLRKGDTVIVVREEETNFLAIQPPPGSLSWIKAIHLGKVELGESKKANVPVAVEGADIAAGSDLVSGPSSRMTLQVARGTIVEVIADPLRVDNATWYPITPPEGDLRWIPKSVVKADKGLISLAPPPIYNRPEPPPYTPSVEAPKIVDKGSNAPKGNLPPILTSHNLWAQANQAEQNRDYSTARALYARIYHDLWEQKAERDAIVICYNRHNRCDEMLKKGEQPKPPANRTESRSAPSNRVEAAGAKWSGPVTLQEVPRVFLEGQPVFSLHDDRGQVLYYTTGIGLKNYVGRRVQVFGEIVPQSTLSRPHLAATKVESAK